MLGNDERALKALADALASKVKAGEKSAPKLRLVTTPSPTRFDSITRDAVLKRVRFLARHYTLQWLVDQEAFNEPSIDCLDDERLTDLLKTLERARECIAEGIPFEDADLVRSTVHDLPEP